MSAYYLTSLPNYDGSGRMSCIAIGYLVVSRAGVQRRASRGIEPFSDGNAAVARVRSFRLLGIGGEDRTHLI